MVALAAQELNMNSLKECINRIIALFLTVILFSVLIGVGYKILHLFGVVG